VKTRQRSRIHALSVLVPALCLAGCTSEPSSDPVVNVAENDSEMIAAIAKARASLPSFWQKFDQPGPGETDFSLKVAIKDANGTEHFWLVDLERKDCKALGTINNDAGIVKSVKNGDRIPIVEADISDWMYMRNGKMVGNYTVRPLFKSMSAEDVAKVKSMLADP
jgi:uncharacterized protein YegJ (DUF2314 family)